MVPIFLASVTPYAGKNVVALGMAQQLQTRGKKLGFFKPIGPLPTTVEGGLADEDAVFFKKVLSLADPLDAMSPVLLTRGTIADIMRGRPGDVKGKTLAAFREVAEGKDAVIAVGMGRLSCGLSLGYPMDEFVRDVRARLLVVDNYRWPVETLDGILHMRNLVGDLFGGVIFNRIAPSKAEEIEQDVRPFLASRGIEVFGVAPNDPVLGAVPIADLVESLNGRVLCCADKTDNLVERFSIGAMNPDAALRVFQRIPNKAVITGGDRDGIHHAALQTSTRCLILTGGLHPNERTLTHAEEIGVPVILTDLDTSATAEICERQTGYVSLNSERKLARTREVLERHLDWNGLLAAVGLK